MAKTNPEIKTAPFESIRSGEVSVGVVSPPFEDIRAGRDQVYGMRARSQPAVSQRIRPVLEGTRSIDDYLPPAYVEVADAQPDPEMYRERTTAAMLLADDMKMDFDMIDRGFDSAVMSRFGEPLSAPQVVDRLSPYKRVPQFTAANEDNWFVTNFEKYIRVPITEATGLFHPYIGEFAYDPVTDKVYKRHGRGLFGRGILGEKPTFIPRAAAKRKGVKEAVGAGLSQAGIRGARSVAGTAEAAGELVRADKLAEWGRLMAEAADAYYVENPDEAMQLISGRGIVGTTYQFITRPEMIVQGVVETVPMLLEAWLGHITGTKAAQVIGKGARVLPWAGRVTGMGTEIFGNVYHDARKAGTPPGPALAQATLTSTIEGMIEEFTLSKKVQVFHGVAGQTAKKGMAKAATNLLLEYTKAYPRGFAEEGTQRMNSNFWRMVFTDKQSLADDFTERLTEGAAEDAAVGGIIEMALTGGFIAAGKAYNLVTDEEKLNRVKNLRNFVRKDPNISAADKKEINGVFDNVKSDILGGKYQQGPATQAFREKVRSSEAIKGDDQKTDVVMALTQARANALGKTTEQFIEDTFVTETPAVDVEGEALFQEGEAKTQNFTQFAKEHGFTSDLEITDHATLSPSGQERVSKRQRDFSRQALQDRIESNKQGHLAYEEAISRGEVIDPEGKITAESLKKEVDTAEIKKAESEITAAENQIKFIESLGTVSHAKSGRLKIGYQRTVDGFNERIDKAQATIDKISAEPDVAKPAERERDLLGRQELRGGAAGKQLEFLNKEEFLTLKERQRRVGKGDIAGQQALFQEAEPGPVFYSKLKNIIETSMPETMDAKQFKNWIVKQGVKKEELAISGIEDLQTDGKVTKQQVLDLLTENAIEVETVVKGEVLTDEEGVPTLFRTLTDEERVEFGRLDVKDAFGNLTDQEKIRFEELSRIESNAITQSSEELHRETKFSQYVLPGGENYRELLLRLPEDAVTGKKLAPLTEDQGKRLDQLLTLDAVRELNTGQQQELHELESRLAGDSESALDVFRAPHFDETNILAHVRMDDRTDSEGDKVLFIEEIQSDWHQQGRVKGYKSPTADESARFEELTQLLDEMDKNKDPVTHQIINEEEFQRLEREHNEILLRRRHAVPDAPFKRTWHELAFKRMLRYAAENGYQKIAWTTGDQQTERYDLSKQIDKLRYTKIGEEYSIQAIKGESAILNKNATARDLPSLVGKDVADRIVAGEGTRLGESNYFELEGDDLKIGGEGMRGFYDRILPNFVNKYAKKWGKRVETTDIGLPARKKVDKIVSEQTESGVKYQIQFTDGTKSPGWWTTYEDAQVAVEEAERDLLPYTETGIEPTPVHSLDITPEMAESVLAGQTLFQAAEGPIKRIKDFFGKKGKPKKLSEIKKEIKEEVENDPIFDIEEEALDVRTRQIDVGVFSIPDNLRGEVNKAIEDDPSLRFNITFDPNKGTPFDSAVQEGFLLRTGDSTDTILDISEFLERVSEAKRGKKKIGGIPAVVLDNMIASGNPFSEIAAVKHQMINTNFTVEDINEAVLDLALEHDLNPEPLLIKEIRDVEEGREISGRPSQTERIATRRKKAAVEFTEDGKAIITAFKAADFSSMVHELGHVFRRTLDVELLTAAEKWAGVTSGVWTTKAEEKFARAFERYLWEGKAPTQKLRSIFAKMREWLRQVYQSVRGTSIDVNLSPAVKETFDKMFTGPAEIHPGEMTKAEFINMAISQLEKRGPNVWIEKYLLNTRETPTQAHRRLKAEWQGQQDSKSAKVKPSEKGVADLTAIQKQQIDRLEAEVVSEDIIQSVKDQPIEELLSRSDSDFFVIADFRQKLVEAFVAGKKTTIETVKRQYKEIFQRSRARKQLREYIQKLARQIAKPAPTTVDLFYREAIAILQLGIDPSFRAKRTLADRQATRKFLEKYPDRELPRKLIEIINKKALNEFTIAELEQLAKERKRLQELGKKKKALRLEAESRKLDEIQGGIVKNIRGQAKAVKQKRLKLATVDAEDIRVVEVDIEKGKKQYDVFYFDEKLNEGAWELDEGKTPESLKKAAKKWLEFGNDDAIAASTTRKPFFKTGFQAARAKTLRPSRIFDMFDGGKATFDGIMHRTFYDAANRATDAELRVQDARTQSGEAKLKELGLTINDLASTRIIAGVEYSVQEMMGIYGFGMNFKSRLAVQFGNKISKRAMAEITHHVESEDPRLAELTNWIIAEFEDNFTRLEDAFIDDQERRLIKEESYLPMRRKELDYTPDKRDLLDDLKASLSIKRAQTKKGFTLERADIPAEFQKPIQLDLWSLWLQQVKWQEHYIHHAKLTRDLHRIAGSEEFRSAVKSVFGEAYVKTTTSWVSRVANPYVYKSFGYWNNASRKLRNNAAMSYLAFNLVTIAKQLPSLLYYLADAGPVYLAASAAEFVTNPMKMINRVRDLDPQVRHPALERTLEELKIQNRQLHDGIIKKVGKAGMQGIYWMDAVARTIGWNAVYRRALESHKTLEPQLAEAEAIRLAQDATLRTQPAAAPKDLAEMYVSNEALNWFLMFSNQLNQIYNITTYDTAGYWTNKQYAKAGLAMTGLVVAGAMIWAATNRKLPDEPEEFIDMLIDTPINMIPLVGREIQTARRGFGGGGIGAIQETAEIFTNIEKGKYGKALESIAVLSGLPTVGPKRVFKAVAEEDITELIGGEPRK